MASRSCPRCAGLVSESGEYPHCLTCGHTDYTAVSILDFSYTDRTGSMRRHDVEPHRAPRLRCSECGFWIDDQRLARYPNTLTCGPACVTIRGRRRAREHAIRS